MVLSGVPIVKVIGESVPRVGTNPVTVMVNVVEFANQLPLAACVNVIVAVPAFPTVIASPETDATEESLELKLHVPVEEVDGGTMVIAGSPTT